jgi:hypothetical protein
MDTFDITYKQTQTFAEWLWKSWYVNVTIPGDDLAKVEGDEKIIGLLQSKMETATLTAHDIISEMIFGDGTGNNSKDYDGLLNAIDDGSVYPTYGGINRATDATWWQAYVSTTGGSVTLDLLNSTIGQVTIAQKKPDLIITTQALYDKIWARVQPQQRFLGENSVLAKVGFTGINFNNHADLLVDLHCPTGYIIFINTEYWKLIFNKKRNFYWTDQKTPVDADAYVKQLLTMGNLICQQPRVQAILTGMT